MDYLTKCFLFFTWKFLLMDISQFCSGHPRVFNDLQVNQTADALQRLLQLFGIERSQIQPRRHQHPPQYMLDLYRTFSEGSSSGESLRFHHGANTVRSFYEKGSSLVSGHYQFDLSNAIPNKEEIVEAQFHFFTNRNIPRTHQSSNVIQIRLYEGMLNSSFNLLEVRMVSAYVPGWEVFKVTHSVKKWILDAEFNKGLSVQILDGSGQGGTNRRLQLQNYRAPILIVFSQDSMRTPPHPTSPRHRIMHHPGMHVNPNPPPEHDLQEEGSLRSARSATVPTTGDCTRHELRVDFEKLGWSNWIISPKWYDAYVCAGACAFPLGQNQRPTNHATVQSIVHELGLTAGVGAPCCVPTDLHSVSLLYFDEHMNVVLKQYDDMVATGCGL